jgi:hypothetical protein
MAIFSEDDYIAITSEIWTLFQKKSRPNYVPLAITGQEIVECLQLTEPGHIEEVFNYLVHVSKFLELNPGCDEVDYKLEDNDFGLCEPYLTSLKRANGLENLL